MQYTHWIQVALIGILIKSIYICWTNIMPMGIIDIPCWNGYDQTAPLPRLVMSRVPVGYSSATFPRGMTRGTTLTVLSQQPTDAQLTAHNRYGSIKRGRHALDERIVQSSKNPQCNSLPLSKSKQQLRAALASSLIITWNICLHA